MHVVQIIDDLSVGGAQQVVATIAREFDYQNNQLSVISLVSKAPLKAELEQCGATVKVLDSKKLISPTFIFRLRKTLRETNADVVQTHLLYANIIGGLASALAKVPSVATLHARDDHPRYRKTLKRKIETLVLRLCHQKWIAVAASVAQSHAPRLPGPRMATIENAISLSKFGPRITNEQRAEMRQRLFNIHSSPDIDCKPDAVWICVSRLVAIKGIEDLLSAFALASARRPGDRLAIVGDGPEAPKLRELAAALNITHKVFMLGHRDDISNLLQCADMFVSAAHSEGLPMSLLEAMAASLPVVHTNVGEVANVINEESGLLVPAQRPTQFADAACALLDRDDRQAVGAAARETVFRFYGGARWMQKLMATYLSIVKPIVIATAKAP